MQKKTKFTNIYKGMSKVPTMGLTHDANALKLAPTALNFPTSLRRNSIELIDDRKN